MLSMYSRVHFSGPRGERRGSDARYCLDIAAFDRSFQERESYEWVFNSQFGSWVHKGVHVFQLVAVIRGRVKRVLNEVSRVSSSTLI
jgi:hypothetical protein